jgi:hypothetical protein
MTNEQRYEAALNSIREKISAVHKAGGAASHDDRKELLLDLHHIASVALAKTHDLIQRGPALTAEVAPLAPPKA